MPSLGLGVNVASVANALVCFNLILGVQTVMDGLYLWTGASLPPGMALASYAHRGAYPLLATALLAEAFALSLAKPDWPYLCDLGPTAAADLWKGAPQTCAEWGHQLETPAIIGWRNGGWRNWRALQALPAPPP